MPVTDTPVTELRNARPIRSARAIARALGPAENSIDTSIVESARLIIAIIEGRQDTGVAPEVGHDAFLTATQSLMSLRTARSLAIRCHRQLTTVRDAMGMTGDGVGCTVTKGRSAATPALEAAA